MSNKCAAIYTHWTASQQKSTKYINIVIFTFIEAQSPDNKIFVSANNN